MLQLGSNLYLINHGTPSASLLQMSGGAAGIDTAFGGSRMPQFESLDHVRWGFGDNQPNLMRKLIMRNTMVRPLLESLRDMIYGSGVAFFKRGVDEKGKPVLTPYSDSFLEEWSEATELQDYLISAINQRVDTANVFTRWQYDPVNKWFLLSAADSFSTRIGTASSGEFHLNPYFGHYPSFTDKETEKIKAFNRLDWSHNQAHTVTISHGKENIAGQPHYAFASWWCAQDAIELANLIMAFHKNGILNGYNIKYLIRMPQDYFDKEGNRSSDAKDVKKRWGDFSDNLSKWLAGQENVNKTMLIKYLRGSDGKMLDNVDVVPLKNEMSDDAYDKVWQTAHQSISNSVGLLPTLAGVKTGSSNDSGSQIRVMADFQSEYRTPVHRHILLKPINQHLKFMGYKDVVAKVMGVQLTTLDDDPNGKKPSVNSGQ